MLRRITSSLTALSLLVVSLSPLTSVFAASNAGQKSPKQQRRESKVAPELSEKAASTQMVRVIVQTKGQPNAAQDDAVTRKGGRRRQTFAALDAMTVDVPANAVAELAAREDVAYVSPDRQVRAEMDVTRETTGASQVQAGVSGVPGLTGKGVGIAIIDSGISAAHPDFQKNRKSRVVAAVNFTGSSTNASSEGDRDGHGTGVAGVAAGNGAASTGYAGNYAGIAPEANLIDLKVLDEHGVGTTSATLSAINWAITNQQRYNIRVINISLGAPARESFRKDRSFAGRWPRGLLRHRRRVQRGQQRSHRKDRRLRREQRAYLPAALRRDQQPRQLALRDHRRRYRLAHDRAPLRRYRRHSSPRKARRSSTTFRSPTS